MSSPLNVRRQVILEILLKATRRLSVDDIRAQLEQRSAVRPVKPGGLPAQLRQVQRDLNALQEANPKLRSDGAKKQGWFIAKEERALPPMTPMVALWFTVLNEHAAHLLPLPAREHLRPYVTHAEGVLEGSALAATWRERVISVPAGQPLEPPTVDSEVVTAVYTAILERRRLELAYVADRKDRAAMVSRVAHPLALIRQGDRTKLVVAYEGSHLPIALHLHFIARATVLDTPSVTPPSFNLAAYVRKGALGFRLSKEKVRVVFLIEPKAGEFLRATPIPGEQCITLEPDGRLRVEVHHYDTHQLRNFLWSFGPAVQVLEPPAMRAAFRKGIAALHEASAKGLPHGEAFTPGEIAAVLEAANAGTTSEAEVAEILARNGMLTGNA